MVRYTLTPKIEVYMFDGEAVDLCIGRLTGDKARSGLRIRCNRQAASRSAKKASANAVLRSSQTLMVRFSREE